ncbi:MAG TPA: 2-phosphosulfolactate phosphatase [Isosphaeraceae bacterium]|jgi:2-phosphosulfolactate phosphatase
MHPPSVCVHLLPELIPPGVLAGGVAVVVDALRATTVMIHALAAGCAAILPCHEVDEARRLAATLPPDTTLLVGERHGRPIAGFDLGNSPSAFTPEVCRGKTLVMTTTNGTRAILSCLEAERILVAAFVNLGATVARLRDESRPVHIVCSGTDGHISVEDALLAGLLTAQLPGALVRGSNDEALIVRSACQELEDVLVDGDPLVQFLSQGRGGRRIRELGLAADIEAAARIDRFDLAAEVLRDPVRIVRLES